VIVLEGLRPSKTPYTEFSLTVPLSNSLLFILPVKGEGEGSRKEGLSPLLDFL